MSDLLLTAMEREVKLSRASRLYQPGTEEFTVSQMPVGVTSFKVSFTREGWPGTQEDNVLLVSLTWSTGERVTSAFPGGVVLGRDGQPALTSELTVHVPFESDGSGGRRPKNVVSGVAVVDVIQALNTAITVEAI